jgi:hypothetical protein
MKKHRRINKKTTGLLNRRLTNGPAHEGDRKR